MLMYDHQMTIFSCPTVVLGIDPNLACIVCIEVRALGVLYVSGVFNTFNY
jgi:hypothetical protein